MEVSICTKKSILIADDEAGILYSLENSLEKEYTVFSANSFQAAIDFIYSEKLDMLITDLDISDSKTKSGLELGRIFQNKFPSNPMILMSGRPDADSRIDAFQKFPNSKFIPKPFDVKEFKLTIEALLCVRDY